MKPSPEGADPLKKDFRKFLWLIWQHLGLPEPTPIQYDIAYNLQHGSDRQMVQAFRGVGKSWITAAFAVWYLYCNPTHNVVVVSASQPRADMFSTMCQRLIGDMQLLHHLRPTSEQRNRLDGFDVGPAGITQSPSMASRGLFGHLTGLRAHLIIGDDIEVSNNSETVTMRLKVSERIREFDAILHPSGRIVFLGTPQTEDSVYKKLIRRGYVIRIWPILFPDEKQTAAYEGRLAPWYAKRVRDGLNRAGDPAEPSRFPMVEVEKRRLSWGRAGFALQFMLDPRLSDMEQYPFRLRDLLVYSLDPRMAPEALLWSGSPEKTLNLECVGMDGDCWQSAFTPTEKPTYRPYEQTIMSIDPAGRGKDETAYSVVSSLGGQLYLRDSGGLKGYETDTLEELANIAKRNDVTKIVVEPNFGDGMFRSLMIPVLQRIYPTCGLEDSERATGNKEKRICDVLEPVISGRRLVVDMALIEKDYRSTDSYDAERRESCRLFYQLSRMTRTKGCLLHDDRVDALALAVAQFTRDMARDMATDAEKAKESERRKRIEETVHRLRNLSKFGGPARPNFARVT